MRLNVILNRYATLIVDIDVFEYSQVKKLYCIDCSSRGVYANEIWECKNSHAVILHQT